MNSCDLSIFVHIYYLKIFIIFMIKLNKIKLYFYNLHDKIKKKKLYFYNLHDKIK